MLSQLVFSAIIYVNLIALALARHDAAAPGCSCGFVLPILPVLIAHVHDPERHEDDVGEQEYNEHNAEPKQQIGENFHRRIETVRIVGAELAVLRYANDVYDEIGACSHQNADDMHNVRNYE